jgi:hypothetical protein
MTCDEVRFVLDLSGFYRGDVDRWRSAETNFEAAHEPFFLRSVGGGKQKPCQQGTL